MHLMITLHTSTILYIALLPIPLDDYHNTVIQFNCSSNCDSCTFCIFQALRKTQYLPPQTSPQFSSDPQESFHNLSQFLHLFHSVFQDFNFTFLNGAAGYEVTTYCPSNCVSQLLFLPSLYCPVTLHFDISISVIAK